MKSKARISCSELLQVNSLTYLLNKKVGLSVRVWSSLCRKDQPLCCCSSDCFDLKVVYRRESSLCPETSSRPAHRGGAAARQNYVTSGTNPLSRPVLYGIITHLGLFFIFIHIFINTAQYFQAITQSATAN